jgi:Bacterial aa3 type cytochrome c oxidase subunit IV
MAAHDTPEYSTAEGNDYAAHEGTYNSFLLLTAVGVAYLANICIALTIGGVKHAWLTAIAIMIVATILAVYGLIADSKAPGYVLVLLSLFALAVV